MLGVEFDGSGGVMSADCRLARVGGCEKRYSVDCLFGESGCLALECIHSS